MYNFIATNTTNRKETYLIRNYHNEIAKSSSVPNPKLDYTTNITPKMALKYGCYLRSLKYVKSNLLAKDNDIEYYQLTTKQGIYIVTIQLQNRKMVIKKWEKM